MLTGGEERLWVRVEWRRRRRRRKRVECTHVPSAVSTLHSLSLSLSLSPPVSTRGAHSDLLIWFCPKNFFCNFFLPFWTRPLTWSSDDQIWCRITGSLSLSTGACNLAIVATSQAFHIKCTYVSRGKLTELFFHSHTSELELTKGVFSSCMTHENTRNPYLFIVCTYTSVVNTYLHALSCRRE